MDFRKHYAYHIELEQAQSVSIKVSQYFRVQLVI